MQVTAGLSQMRISPWLHWLLGTPLGSSEAETWATQPGAAKTGPARGKRKKNDK